MTAATLTAAQETVRYAGAVLHEALATLQTAELPAAFPAIVAAWRLDRALEDVALIATGEISWERFYPELAAEPDPHEAALEKAAAEAGDCAEALIRAIAGAGGEG